MSEVKQEVLINWDGEAIETKEYPRFLLDEGEYEAELLNATIGKFKKYNSEDKEVKIVLLFKVPKQKNMGDDAELYMYLNPKITKGNQGYSNSKIYDVLLNCGLLNQARGEENSVSTFEGIRSFLEKHLSDKKLRVYVKTSKKGTEEAYSKVAEVLGIIEDNEVVVEKNVVK